MGSDPRLLLPAQQDYRKVENPPGTLAISTILACRSALQPLLPFRESQACVWKEKPHSGQKSREWVWMSRLRLGAMPYRQKPAAQPWV